LAGAISLKRDVFHYKWNREHKPVAHIKPGDSVRFEINEVLSWQVTKKSKADVLARLDESKFYMLSGPVYVDGASPGDALKIIVDEVKTADWGWSAVIPGFGILDEFRNPYLWIWNLENRRYAPFKSGIKVPLRPFCGVMGLAPSQYGSFDVMPPGKHGGNLDNRHLTAGSELLLPVWVEGGLFSVGDVHAAQGDGEVCVTAIECPGEVSLTFDVLKDMRIQVPRYTCTLTEDDGALHFATTGIAPDLMDASKQAVREMVKYLSENHGLTKEEAYILCSVQGDLRIHEVVDKPNWVVGMMMSSRIFSKQSRSKFKW
jgi:acetamidase/formamidase